MAAAGALKRDGDFPAGKVIKKNVFPKFWSPRFSVKYKDVSAF